MNSGEHARLQKRTGLLSIFIVTMLGCLIPLMGLAGTQEGAKLLTLEDAYQLALKNHEQILIAEREIRKSKLLPNKAWSSMLPNSTASGSYTTVNKSITGRLDTVILPKDQLYGNIGISQNIYDAKFFPQRKKGLQTIDKSLAAYWQTIQDVLFHVAQTYHQTLRAMELVRNAQEMIKLGREELKVAQSKLAAGAVTEEARLRAELDLTGAESRLIESSNLLKLALDTLNNLIGLKEVRSTVAKPEALADSAENYENLLKKAWEHRNDHKAFQWDVEIAKSEVNLAKAKFHPSLSGSWDYYAVNNPAFNQLSNNWIAGLKIDYPFLEGGLRYWELREKKESLKQAELALEDKKRNIRIEVDDAMLAVQNHKSILAKLRKQVELAQKSYDITFSKFKYGAATMLDLSQAFISLDSAKIDLINKTYEYQMSLINLEKAEGIFALDLMREKAAAYGKSSSPNNYNAK